MGPRILKHAWVEEALGTAVLLLLLAVSSASVKTASASSIATTPSATSASAVALLSIPSVRESRDLLWAITLPRLSSVSKIHMDQHQYNLSSCQ